MQKLRKALAVFLSLCMLLSLFTGTAVMAGAEDGVSVEKVTALADGESYLITATDGDVTYALSPDTISTASTGWRAAEAVTIQGGAVTSPADISDLTWNYTEDGGFQNAGDSSLVLRMSTSYIFTNGAATTTITYDGETLVGNGKTVQLATQTVGGLATYCFDTAGGTSSGTTKSQTIELYKVVTAAAHEHSYTETVTKEATCGEDGVKTFTCDCGDSYTQSIPATGAHTYVNGVCSVYGAEEETGSGEDSGETHEHSYVAVDDGNGTTHTWKCSCGALRPGEGVTVGTEGVSAFEAGKKYAIVSTAYTYALSSGDFTYTSGTNPNYRAGVAYTAGTVTDDIVWTYTAEGYLQNGSKYLTNDGATSNMFLTMADTGSTTWSLEDGYLRSSTGNYLMNTVANMMGCTTNKDSTGVVVAVYEVADNGPTEAHTYVDGTCSACGAEEPAHVHNWVTDAAVEPTCTTAGKTEGSHCSGCGEVQTAQTEIPALGHSYVNGVCTRCGEKKAVTQVYVTPVDTLEAGNIYLITNTDGTYAMSVNTATSSSGKRAAVEIQIADGAATASGADMNDLLWTASAGTTGVSLMGNGDLHLVTQYSYIYANKTVGSYCDTWKFTNGVLQGTKYTTYSVSYTTSGFGTSYGSNSVSVYKVSLCNHENKSNEVTVEATCTADGSYSFHCNDCGEDITQTLPALGHNGVLQNETEDYWEFACSRCGLTYQTAKDARLKAMSLTGVFATFSTDGTYEWEYDADNNRLQSTNYHKGSSHSVTTITLTAAKPFLLSFDYSVNSESNYDYLTLTLDGTQLASTKVSSKNGITLSFNYPETELAAGEHTLVLDYQKDSSGDQGDDRAYISNFVAAQVCDHNWVKGDTVAPTCTEEGYTVYTCSICSREKHEDIVEALGHQRDGTYTDNWNGTHTYGCSRTEDCAGGVEAHTYVDGVCACGALEPVVVGTTTGSNTTPYPYYTGMKNSTTQTIYTASEIGKAGTIKSVAYEVVTAAQVGTTSVKIYMANTAKEKFLSTSDFLAASELTLVYDGTPTLGKAAGWEELKLDTPFFYNGVDNLAVVVVVTNDTAVAGLSYRYTSQTDRILYRGSSTNTSYGDLTSTASYTKGAYVPNVQLRIEAHTHTWVNGTVVAPTCVEQGYTPVTCACGASTKSEITAALGHSYDESNICTRCGAKKIEAYADLFYLIQPYFDLSGTAAAAEKWTAETYNGEEVAKSSGTNTITLTAQDDGILNIRVAQKLVGASYASNGYVTITVKDAAGETLSTKSVTGHSDVAEFETVSVHVTEGQTVTVYCYCYSQYYFQYMSAFTFTPDCVHTHAESDAGTVTLSTCTERGYTSFTCTTCGKTYRTNYTDPLGHDYLETVVQPTCTEKGKKINTCQRAGCDSVVETEIPANGHQFENGYCTVCHEKSASFVEIGTGTTTGYNAPYGNYQYYSGQFLYTADQIGSGGTITDIAFNVGASAAVKANTLRVYMGHKADTTFASASDKLTLDQLTLVYEHSDVTFGSDRGWEQLTLDTPFNYDGANSLVVVMVAAKSAASWDTKYVYTSTANSMLYTYSSNINASNYNDLDSVTYGAKAGYLPNIQITFKAEASSHPTELTAVPVSGNCVDGGNLAYWTCSVCHRVFSDAQGLTEITLDDVTLPAGGEHTYENGVCTKCGAQETAHVHDLTHVEAVAAACKQDGNIEYWYCADCGKYYSDAAATTEITQADTVIAGLGHNWGEASYEWTETEDGYSVTGTVACLREGCTTAPMTETVQATYAVTTPATEDAPGEGTWTATFTNKKIPAATRTEVIPQLEGDPLRLVAHEVENGVLTIDLVAGKDITFSVMEYTLKCTYGNAKLTGIASAITGAEPTVNTKTGYIGLYANTSDVTVAKGGVIATFTFSGVDADGSYRFRLSAGDCYVGEDTQLPWSADYTGEDKADLPDAIEMGTPGEDVEPVEPVTTIATADDLKNLAETVNAGVDYTDVTVTVTADIVLSGEWTAVGTAETPFTGVFDGQGHTISGLVITDCTGGYKGLFGRITGTVKNFTVTGTIGTADAYITSGSDNIGGAVGWNDGTVSGVIANVTVYVNTSSIYAVGGVVGQNGASGTITQCANLGDVTATKNSGGVCGRSYGVITQCYNSGTITGNGGGKDGIGGIAGLAGNKDSTYKNSVTYCYNTGKISNNNGRWHGGIVGMADSASTVTNCYNVGEIVKGYSWNWNPIIGHVDSAYATVHDNYSLEGLLAGDTNASTVSCTVGTVKTADELKGLAATLGEYFVKDRKNLNNGYPVLKWQAGDDVTLDITVTKPDAATVTEPEGGWVEGENTFTVSAPAACVVAVSKDGGLTYTVLEATANDDGSYSFTADVTADTTVTVVVKGDVDGDGSLGMTDAMAAMNAWSNGQSLGAAAKLAGCVTGSSDMSMADAMAIMNAWSNGGFDW